MPRNIDTSIIAPQGGESPIGAMAPEMPPQEMGGAKLGQMEAIKSSIKWLLEQGMSAEEIIQTILKLAGNIGLDIDESQLQSLLNIEGGGNMGVGTEMPSGMEGQPKNTPLM